MEPGFIESVVERVKELEMLDGAERPQATVDTEAILEADDGVVPEME